MLYAVLQLVHRYLPHWPKPSICVKLWCWGETAEVSSLPPVTVITTANSRELHVILPEAWWPSDHPATSSPEVGLAGGRGLMLCCGHTSFMCVCVCAAFLGLFAFSMKCLLVAHLWNMQSHWCIPMDLEFEGDAPQGCAFESLRKLEYSRVFTGCVRVIRL